MKKKIRSENSKKVYLLFFFSYASAKRCSNEGRALMQLDFQQLLRRLERIIDDLKYVLFKDTTVLKKTRPSPSRPNISLTLLYPSYSLFLT